jgi:hypothetical protein
MTFLPSVVDSEKRANELQALRGLLLLESLTSTVWLTAPTLAAVASFLIKSLVRIITEFVGRVDASGGER